MATRRESLSDQIRRLIDASDESRYRIAKEAGIDHSAMSRFMNGERGLSMVALDAIADYMGWSIIETENKRKGK